MIKFDKIINKFSKQVRSTSFKRKLVKNINYILDKESKQKHLSYHKKDKS